MIDEAASAVSASGLGGILGMLCLLAAAVNVLKLFRLEAGRDMEKPQLVENTRIITSSVITMIRAVFFILVAFLLSQV